VRRVADRWALDARHPTVAETLTGDGRYFPTLALTQPLPIRPLLSLLLIGTRDAAGRSE